MEEFKNTIMGKITKGAIFAWGENNEKGEWFVPTEEQTEAIFDTSSFISKSDDIIKLDDLTEAKNPLHSSNTKKHA